MRFFKFNADSPVHDEITSIVKKAFPVPAIDVISGYLAKVETAPLKLAEPAVDYNASKLRALIIAGPNGAGKSTFARHFLRQESKSLQFINADYLAFGLSPFNSEQVQLRAGRLMINEIKEKVNNRTSFAIETTLSGQRYMRAIPEWQKLGYAVKLIFLSLPSPEMAVARVALRVRQGGHNIPPESIIRRFKSGLNNFNNAFKSLVDTWAHYDSSGPEPILLDEGE